MSNDFFNHGNVNDNNINADNINENLEWELSDLVDAIAAEIDEAQNTLSLKSHVRGLSFAIKKLSFDIEVKARRTANGKYQFRTINADETSATILRLDFAQVLQSQLTQFHKLLDNNLSIAGVSSLDFLPDISSAQIKALSRVGITSLNELEHYPKTPQALARLSRKTGIDEYRIRMWRQLPFITTVNPDCGLPGSTVTIEGGNFGNSSDSKLQVFFQQKPAKIKDRQAARLMVEMPSGVDGTGSLVVQINSQITNPIQWRVIKALSKLKIGDYRTIYSFDPLLNADLGPAEVMSLIFRGLAYLDPKNGTRTPDLAREWQILPSAKAPDRFRVYLHDQIYFHDQNLLTAEDVQFTYQKILELPKSPWHQLAKCTIETVIVEDEKTIDFVLRSKANQQALAGLIVLLTIGIVPNHLYQNDPDRFARKPVGCGPFQLQAFAPGKTIELSAFLKYLQGKPKLDQIKIEMGMSQDELMQLLNDSVPTLVNFQDSDQLKRRLIDSNQYTVSSVQAVAPILTSVKGSPALLTVQSKQLQERSANQFNPNWNAHLWYLQR